MLTDFDTASLPRYLNHKLDEMDLEADIDVEMQPDTEHGCPDILINDLLALELKVERKTRQAYQSRPSDPSTMTNK